MLTRAVIVAAVLALAACGTAGPTQPAGTPDSPEPTPAAGTVQPATPLEPGPPTAQAASPTGPAKSPTGPAGTSPASPAPPGDTPSADGGWVYLADFPAEAAIEVAGVTAHADGWAAVGFEPYPGEGFGGRRNGVVWTSPDGLNWSRSAPQALASTSLRSVVSLNGQLFAWGEYSTCPELSEEEECVDAADAGIALWRSDDAREWQRLGLPDSLRTGILDGALTDGTQLIAHGSSGDELLGAVWLSPNGEQWSEVRELGGLDPINAVGAGAGRLVAFGLRYLPEEDDVETLAGWSEGGAFAPAQLPVEQRGVVQDVAWSEAGFVAVGVEHDPTGDRLTPIALASADGLSWTAATPEQLPQQASFEHVLGLPSGFLALGAVPAGEPGREQPFAWFSEDGLEWREQAPLTGGAYRQLSSSARGPDGIVVFASDFEASDELEPVEPELGTVHGWFAALENLP